MTLKVLGLIRVVGLGLAVLAAVPRASPPPAESRSEQEPRQASYPWSPTWSRDSSVASRIGVPEGFGRFAVAPGSYGEWLRNLPLKPANPDVRLYDGRPKANQSGHYAVLDIDVGTRDLQQCADAVIRLRAEYLRASVRDDSISFRFTSGHLARWTDWKTGMRPVVRGADVRWQRLAPADSSYRSFRAYLDAVFTYAGSQSLEKELRPVADERAIEPGDVFIQGGSPGHAVIVIDVAEKVSGERVFLIAQSYMPAQDIHILVNPNDAHLSPWYPTGQGEALRTPEWRFPAGSLRRFESR